ncbi:MAG: PAS domain-containing protein [Boseongicola sp.]|nr:PAS domain-containing protein [Boseongicola sp.]
MTLEIASIRAQVAKNQNQQQADTEMAERNSKNEVVDLIAGSFAPAAPNLGRQMINPAGARAPEIIWSPTDVEIRNPLLREFAAICRVLARDDETLPDGDIDLGTFGDLKEWIMIIERVEGENDFIYSYYGEGIAQHYGRDMTGHRSSEFTGHVGTFFTGLYGAMLERNETVYSEHEPPQNVFVRAWQRYIVPRVNDAGEITGFIALNVPENELRAGLELMIDPVMVVTEDEKIVYANRSAQAMFKLPTVRRDEAFEPTTGMALNPCCSPVEMLAAHRIEDSVQLTIREAIVERLVMTVSAAQYKDTAYYVVVMRLIGT